MRACKRCGSDRHRSAPLPVIDAIVGALTGRRRYACTACGVKTWRHRLARRGEPLAPQIENSRPTSRAYSLFILVLGFTVVAAIGAMSNCQSSDGRGTMSDPER